MNSVLLDTETGTRIGLYKFLEAARVCPSGGKKAWQAAVEQNLRRAKPLPLPDLRHGKIPGNRRDTKLFKPCEIGMVIAVGLSRDAQEQLYGSKIEELCELVTRAGGDAENVHSAAKSFSDAQSSHADQIKAVCPIAGDVVDFLVEQIGDTVYAGIIMYLTRNLGLDGRHEWSNWLQAKFEHWVAQFSHTPGPYQDSVVVKRSPGSDQGDSDAPLLIYRKPDGYSMPTPLTTYRGFNFINKECVGRSIVSSGQADEALDILARFKVGDQKLHQELIENAQTAASIEKAFVLGVQEARCQDENLLLVTPNRSPPVVLDVPGFSQGDHTYLFSTGLPGILKIGRSADAAARKNQIQRELSKIDNSADVHTLAVWKYCGVVEKYLHRVMAPFRAEVSKLTEYYKCEPEQVKTAFPEALAAYHEESALSFGGDERAAKRQRLDTELEEEEVRLTWKLKKEQMEAEMRRAEAAAEAEAKLKKEQMEAEAKRAEELADARHQIELGRLRIELAEVTATAAVAASSPQIDAHTTATATATTTTTITTTSPQSSVPPTTTTTTTPQPGDQNYDSEDPNMSIVRNFIATQLVKVSRTLDGSNRGDVQDALKVILGKSHSRSTARSYLRNCLLEVSGHRHCYGSRDDGRPLKLK